MHSGKVQLQALHLKRLCLTIVRIICLLKVREVGLEPTRSYDQQILNLSRLPVTPLAQSSLTEPSDRILRGDSRKLCQGSFPRLGATVRVTVCEARERSLPTPTSVVSHPRSGVQAHVRRRAAHKNKAPSEPSRGKDE